ncbi:uncharacterized protein LOC121757540 [Salvia splendens]|uniref:uncharacterized protein LOC121757540 n=1 Tax=Salvia splendens TaxID=180675 RepID=UPI001C25AF45|nr:uncharacterized protein LOC121757540 [Salvia splendens]
MEKKLLEAVEKSRAPPPPAPKEQQYTLPPPSEEHHYYYCEFPPEAEPLPQVNAFGHWNANGNWIQGKQIDAPWRDHPNFRWTDQNQSQPPQPSTQQMQPSEGHPNWPVGIQDRPNTGGNIIQGVTQGNWSDGGQPNWSSRQSGGNWGYRLQGPQSSNQGKQPNNQMVSYVPPHQRGNLYPINQQYNQPQYQQEHYGQYDYPQPNYRNPRGSEGAAGGVGYAEKATSQVAMSLGEMRGKEGGIPATVQTPGRENISEVTLRLGKAYQGPTPPVESPAFTPGPSHEGEGESSKAKQAKESEKG